MNRHPWNTSFEWASPRGPHRRISREQACAWDAQGFFVVEGAFDAVTVREVLAEIDPIEERVTQFLRAQPDGKMFIAEAGNITFSVHLVLHSPWLRAFCANPVFQDLGHDLIGFDVRLYWDQAVYKKPEKPATFPWHQDNGYTYVEPQQYLTCWVALTDASVANGCPWVVPGLHRLGTLEHWMTARGWQCLTDPAEAVPVEAPAGSIIVLSSLTPHSTGPNRTDGVRKAYIVQFAPDGAAVMHGEAASGTRTLEPQNAPERQYLILRGGRPVIAD